MLLEMVFLKHSSRPTAVLLVARYIKHWYWPIVVFCVASVLKYNSSPTAVLWLVIYLKHNSRPIDIYICSGVFKTQQ
tara:strand:+ start:680 stop:910 length:231 start_codon:yes stop_codon:yes gene_type:complete